ncbi:hypothetical protein BC828DRAFT_407972 [Blastocladiella britannica]|nr:hypothetical protein BC828DRAFT_407972 [Blastocladiella britannica]
MSSSPPRPPPPPPSAPSGASMRLVRTHFRPTSEVVTAAPQLQPQPPPAATDWRQEQHHHHQLPVHARSSLPPTSLPHQVSPYPIGSRYDSGPYPHGYGPMPSSSWPPLFGQGLQASVTVIPPRKAMTDLFPCTRAAATGRTTLGTCRLIGLTGHHTWHRGRRRRRQLR